MVHQAEQDPSADKGIPRDPRITDAAERRAFLEAVAEGRINTGMLPRGVVLQALAAEAVSRPKVGRPRKKKGAEPEVSE